ncbi:MAG: hypothetical protein QX196_15415 [Methylococcaceae bacterium]
MMYKKLNGLAALLMSCALLPTANAKEAHAAKYPKADEQSAPATTETTDKIRSAMVQALISAGTSNAWG